MNGGGILFHKGFHWVGKAYCRDGGVFTAFSAHPRLCSLPVVSFQSDWVRRGENACEVQSIFFCMSPLRGIHQKDNRKNFQGTTMTLICLLFSPLSLLSVYCSF